MKRLGLVSLAALCMLAAATPAQADESSPSLKPHVGFYVIHPRVGLATYFSLSSAWAGTQAPLRAVAKIHPAGENCGTTAAADTGAPLMSATLRRENHHTVWKNWTPTRAGSYVVCTWLGDPAIATGSSSLTIAGRAAGVTPVGSLISAMTSKTPTGPARAVFPTAPRSVYARFALSGVKRGALVTIAFRDTNGRSVVTHQRSRGPTMTWYTAHVSHDRIAERLGYWLASVRVGDKTLGSIHFLVPNYG